MRTTFAPSSIAIANAVRRCYRRRVEHGTQTVGASGSATDERPALSRPAIVAAARRIADSEGLPALTLRRVAAEFGTGQASLYRHIAGRAELLCLLADDLADGYPVVRSGSVGSAAGVVRQWLALYRHLADHPWAAGLIAEGVYLGQGAEDTARALLAQLRGLGLDADAAARLYRGLWHLTLGNLLSDHPFGQPHTRATVRARRSRPVPAEDAYGWEVRRLIAGARGAPA